MKQRKRLEIDKRVKYLKKRIFYDDVTLEYDLFCMFRIWMKEYGTSKQSTSYGAMVVEKHNIKKTKIKKSFGGNHVKFSKIKNSSDESH